MSATDHAYHAVIGELPRALRRRAEELPRRLGLSGGWEDYVQLPLLRDLPLYAGEGLELTPERRDRFVRAHLRAGFFGLLADRIADGQADDRELLPHFEQAWREALTVATDDRRLAHGLIDAAMRSLSRGLAEERDTATARRLTPLRYWRCSCWKVAWLATSSLALLYQANEKERASQFLTVFDLLLFSSQCIDDAQDESEDERLFGISVPRALGFPAAALVRAVPRLLGRAEELARAARYSRLADELARRAAQQASLQTAVDLRCELAALIICETVEGTCASRTELLDTPFAGNPRTRATRRSSSSSR
jgi:hypothetical protein